MRVGGITDFLLSTAGSLVKTAQDQAKKEKVDEKKTAAAAAVASGTSPPPYLIWLIVAYMILKD